MQDWEQYAVKDEWEQYAVPTPKPTVKIPQGVKKALGVGIGVGSQAMESVYNAMGPVEKKVVDVAGRAYGTAKDMVLESPIFINQLRDKLPTQPVLEDSIPLKKFKGMKLEDAGELPVSLSPRSMARGAESLVLDLVAAKGAVKGVKALPQVSRDVQAASKILEESVTNPEKALVKSKQIDSIIESAGKKAKRQFGKDMKAYQAMNPGQTVSFSEAFNRPRFSPDLNRFVRRSKDTIDLYDLDNMSLEQSQQLLNDLKSNLTQQQKLGVIKPNQRDIIGFIDDLQKSQEAKFPQMADTRKRYGNIMDAYNEVSEKGPDLLEGSQNRIKRAEMMENLGKLSPKSKKYVESYRKGRAVRKVVAPFAKLGVLGEIVKNLD